MLSLGSGFDQVHHSFLGPEFAGAAPIQIKKHVHVALTPLHFGHMRLVDFQSSTKFGLCKSGRAAEGSKVLAKNFVSAMVD